MSEIKVDAITDAAGGNTVTINGYTPTLSNMAGRNRIINGDMRIDQRNAGAAVTVNGFTKYSCDRFVLSADGGGVFSGQQSSTAPDGFRNSLALTVTTADSTASSGDQYWIEQRIEGNNFADMMFGTATAKTMTLSFWVRSSVTGTYSVAFRSTYSGVRDYVSTYTINSANTWEYKTITVSGDTTGTWPTDNNTGINVMWDLGSGTGFDGTAGSWSSNNYYRTSGSVRWIATNGATFYITGVQLEAGSVATPFERRPYGTELALCQRYFQYFRFVTQFAATNANNMASMMPVVAMRATPTVTRTANAVTGAEAGSVVLSASNYGYDCVVYAQNSTNTACGGYGTLSAEL